MSRTDDTIVALASAPGAAARSVVRLSGPRCLEVLEHIWQWHAQRPQLERPRAEAGQVRLPGLASPIPTVLYLWPNSRSYTREPVAELHLPGSAPLADAVLGALCAAGARLAQPGEFTMRAFLAGRLDLTQAEAVLGVIDAQDARQLESALAQLAGGIARPLAELRDELLELLAHVEASLDFAEEHLDFIPRGELVVRLQGAAKGVASLRGRLRGRNLGDPLPRVVLAGRPNAGKSSLFNALVSRYGKGQSPADLATALVAPVAGTTRDYLTAALDIDGVGCELVDTAGIAVEQAAVTVQPVLSANSGPAGGRLEPPCSGEQTPTPARVPVRPTAGPDEQVQQVTAELRRQACIELWCIDSTQPIDTREQTWLAEARADRLVVWTKADAIAAHGRCSTPFGCELPVVAANFEPEPAEQIVQAVRGRHGQPVAVATSAVTGQGLGDLAARLRAMLVGLCHPGGEAVASTAQRAEEHLRAAQGALDEACRLALAGETEEVLAVEIRSALDALGCVSGAVYTEDLLDRIFSRFCIGK